MFSPFNSTDVRFGESNAEPMNLGSPVSSPKSKANTNQNYLPPYLFGETSSPQSNAGASSWNQTKTTSIYSPSVLAMSPTSSFSHSIVNTPSAGKSGGPPVQGLMYSPTSSARFTATPTESSIKPSRTPAVESSTRILTPNKSFSLNNSTFLSPAQIDPFFTQGEALKNSEQLDESWVTVFGFPSASAEFVLRQFSQYGTITEHKVSPNGNWMHIKYQSKLQAKKALSKNGKILNGNIMIGVKPCIEMDLMEAAKENSRNDISSPQSYVTSPLNDSLYQSQDSTKPNLKRIRPLTSAYQSPETPTPAKSPKSGSIVTRALDYLWKL